jgi:ATP-dependent Clp protease ATP-binding subunit ClpA
MVREVQKRLEERDITFELTPEAGMWLAKEGL